jgi:succinyl-CoA synthetase beta subunit
MTRPLLYTVRVKLLEYEAKAILKEYSIPVPASELVQAGITPPLPAVVKSQVPVGGRGKAGGIKVATNPAELAQATESILNLEIKGHKPSVLLAEELLDIVKEFYLSILIDRDTSSIQLLANKNGGVEVEDNNPDSFLKLPLDAHTNFDMVGEQLAEYLDTPEQTFALEDIAEKLYRCFIDSDATLIEINPLVLTADSNLVAGDCKMELDDAALFRHPEWDFEDKPANTNFVTLDPGGEVATIANGAGLAMATVDAVADAGLRPANFLDIGGGANEQSVLNAFNQIMEYPNVSAIIINIFAGITRCDEVAKAIIAAKEQIEHLPKLYIRLAGTNYEAAEELLAKSHITLLPTLESCINTLKEEQA